MTRHSWTAGFRNSCEESWQQQCLLLCVLQSGGESCRTFVLKQIQQGKKHNVLALESATYLHCTCWIIVNPDHVCWFYTFASMERRKCFKRLRFDFLTPCFLPPILLSYTALFSYKTCPAVEMGGQGGGIICAYHVAMGDRFLGQVALYVFG